MKNEVIISLLENEYNLVINSTLGDIEVNEVSDVTITSTSGDVRIGIANNSLNIEITFGDIDINDLTIMEDSSIKVISGDVKMSDDNRHADYEMKINAKSGDIIIK